MEAEFDKEIDAMLRLAASDPALGGTMLNSHLEADEIAAFAENALPSAMRSHYVKHLSDCGRCRKILAQTITLYPEAEMDAASSAVVSAAVLPIRKPWFQRIFAIPNLAASMGALVLVFASVFGYLLYQRTRSSGDSDIARVSEPAFNKSMPLATPSSASSANAMSNSAASAEPSPSSSSDGGLLNKTLGQNTPDQPMIGDRKEEDLDTKSGLQNIPSASQPPPPPASAPLMTEAPKRSSDEQPTIEKKVVKPAESVTVDGVESDPKDKRDARSLNETAPTTASGGAVRSRSVISQSLKQKNSKAEADRADSLSDSPTNTRNVGGKSFQKKNGVWYDSAYQGRTTTNVRRGTAAFHALDTGLQNIANGLDGTVVIDWKGTAYRIQ